MLTLQLLHASDLEGGVDALDNAPNFAATVDGLEAQAAEAGIASILLSAGDNFIPGPFFNAGGDPSLAPTFEGFYNQFFGLIDVALLPSDADTNGDGFFDNDEIQAQIDAGNVTVEEVYTTDVNGDGFVDFFEEIDTAAGRVDAAIMNSLGLEASAVGNHEFDAGTSAFEDIINFDRAEGNDLSDGRFGDPNFLQEVDTPGIQFPYLSANLDFSQDGAVGTLFIDALLPNTEFQSDLSTARVDPDDPAAPGDLPPASKIAPATTVEVDGEQLGIVGATTQLLASLTNSGTVDDVSNPGTEDMPALAAVLQPVVDELTEDGINKIILVSHLQQLALETELAGLLDDVDIIVAGGSDTILADDTDRLRPGDTAENTYPRVVTDNGETTLVVSTAGEYSYVGRLVVEFDEDGAVIVDSIDPELSGAFATDEQGVLDVTGAASLEDAIAASEKATEVDNLVNAVTRIVTELDGDIAGETAVFLNGQREDVRTEETNLGNLTADANLAAAQESDAEVEVSLKNGGGIRASIGEIVDTGTGEAEFLPPAANPVSGKQEGQISELDIDNALRFDNGLVIVELTPEELKIILEHGVAATAEGDTPGQFPQIGGIQFSFDPDNTAQEISFDPDAPDTFVVDVEGERVQNVALLNADGTSGQQIVVDGEVTPDAPASIKVVTLNFLADGGDGYPFLAFSDITPITIDGGETLGEQQALSEFLTANHPPDGDTPFDEADTPIGDDTRIQNLNERDDTIGEGSTDGDGANGGGADGENGTDGGDGGGSDGGTDLDAPVPTLDLEVTTVGEFIGEGGEGAAEVVATEDGVLYVTNGTLGRIDVFDITAGPTPPTPVDEPDGTIDLTALEDFDGVQSVAVGNGVVAVAIARAPEESTVFGETVNLAQPGFVALFDAATLELLSTVDVGNLPDQLTFSADGSTLLVAGEGEKNEDSENDNNPLGTVAIIDVSDPTAPVVELLDFTDFNGLEAAARANGVRLQEGISFAEDVEPEFIAITPDGTTAFVSLQENNALAKIDLTTGAIVDVLPLGTVDFSSESELDVNDNGEIEIGNFPINGLRMPDAIASFEVDGQTFVATANEGDSRGAAFDDEGEPTGFDEARVSEAVAQGLFDEALVEQLTADGLIDDDPDTDIGLERLEISTIDGDTDGDGDIDVPHTFSTRSFAIFDEAGNLVFDSGSEFGRFIAANFPERFNDDDGGPDENRSDAKGNEPEAVTVGEFDGRLYAFIGAERDSGIFLYDITQPAEAFFVNYIEPKFVDFTPEDEVARHGPETIAFIPADESTTGNPQIAAAYEISGTTILYDLVASTARTSVPAIQGTAHTSPLEGEEVRVGGIVTAVDTNGFYLQDPVGDGDIRTSDAVFVFTGSAPTVAVGDEIVLQGTVSEFTPGGVGTGNLSTTQLSDITDLIVLASDRELPDPVVIGGDGRLPPSVIIDDDALTSFDVETDGIDFFESLESMRVTANATLAVSGTNRFGEIFTVVDNGEGATGLSERGTLNISPFDFNPEKVQIDEDSGVFDFAFPTVDVGAALGDVTGVVGYSFGNFEIIPTEDFTGNITPSELEPETVPGDGAGALTIASYNVLNLDPVVEDIDNVNENDPDEIDDDVGDGRFAAIAEQIVANLAAPAVIALQEIQDNDGAEVSDVTAADETLQTLVDAIVDAGGPAYAFIDTPDVPPTFLDADGEVDSPVGGQPGGNIRNAFLYDPERVGLVDGSVETITDGDDDPFPFFEGRIPLVATFEVDGSEVTLVNNHFSSKGGSAPILGVEQPFDLRQEDPDVNGSLDQRRDQAQAVRSFVDELIDDEPDANIVVLGDLNEFEFVSPVLAFSDNGFSNLTNTLAEDERYSFIFQGNSQSLDHIALTDNLAAGALFDAVQVNSEFAETPERASDHDPLWAALDLDGVSDPMIA